MGRSRAPLILALVCVCGRGGILWGTKHLPISWVAEIALFLKSVVGGKVDLVISESVLEIAGGDIWELLKAIRR